MYIATGDGGGSGDRRGNAQNPDQRLGKILRINVDADQPYTIPPGNPFATGGGAPEIFALGLRNPWHAAFDGDQLYIGDAGQKDWEEVSILSTADAGANLGWNRVEGLACFKADTCDATGLTPPVYVYDHSLGCMVTGGLVYRGTAMPALQGRYFFSDFCAATLMSFRLMDGAARISSASTTASPASARSTHSVRTARASFTCSPTTARSRNSSPRTTDPHFIYPQISPPEAPPPKSNRRRRPAPKRVRGLDGPKNAPAPRAGTLAMR